MPEWIVRYIDYASHYRSMREEILATIDDTLDRGDVMLRQQLTDFESNLAAFCGTTYAIGVGNCTEGLEIALRAAGIGPGDEVITVAHTFVATAAAIHHAGATPVFVDIADDHLVDVTKIHEAVTPKTKAIMPVQLNGRVCDMDEVMRVADHEGLLVIEDSAQALGAKLDGKQAGSFGVAGCFSFYPAKLLGTFGDAGAITTSDPEMNEKVRLLRNHGRTPDNDIAFWSYNSRMDNIHAAILSVKMRRLPSWLERRRKLAAQYHEALTEIDELVLPPQPMDEGLHWDVFQNYEIEAESRDRLFAHLTSAGVETMIPWGGRAVHQFSNLGLRQVHLPRTELMMTKALMLPMYVELTEDKVAYVCDQIRLFYRGSPKSVRAVGLSG